VASDSVVVGARAVPVQPAPPTVTAWRRTFRTAVVTLIAAAITPFIVPVPHARAALRRARKAIERARHKEDG
jgi:hypothetical protein